MNLSRRLSRANVTLSRRLSRTCRAGNQAQADTPALKGRVVVSRSPARQREERNSPKNDANRIKELIGGKVVTAPAAPTTAGLTGQRDPLVLALCRYVEALHRRYPDGPDQMRQESLDARANMPRMCKSERVSVA